LLLDPRGLQSVLGGQSEILSAEIFNMGKNKIEIIKNNIKSFFIQFNYILFSI